MVKATADVVKATAVDFKASGTTMVQTRSAKVEIVDAEAEHGSDVEAGCSSKSSSRSSSESPPPPPGNRGTMNLQDLPPGWESIIDVWGRVYFFHRDTGITQYWHPAVRRGR